MTHHSLESLLARCQPGWSLPGDFYKDDAVYRLDLARVWRRGWIFAGHACEIPEAGDYFTLEVDTDSVIVVRGEDGTIHGLHNIKANFDHYNADDATPRIREEMNAAVARSERKWAAAGLAPTHTQAGMARFPDAERNILVRRQPHDAGRGLGERVDGRPARRA